MSSTTIKNVAIMGASGTVGAPVLSALLASNAFTITVLTRAGSSSPTLPAGMKVVKIADYGDVDEVARALQGQDAFLANVPNPNAQYTLIDAAVKAGVRRYVSSEYGIDNSNPEMRALVSIFQDKAAVEEYLQSKESSSFTWSSIVTGPFLTWGLSNGLLGFDLKHHTATLYDVSSPALMNTTTFPQIGRSVVSLLLHPEPTRNRRVYVHSFLLTGRQLLERLQAVSGPEKKWTVQEASTLDAEREGKALMEKGEFFPGLFNLLKVPMWRAGTGGDYSRLGKDDNELLGLEQENLDAVLAEVYAQAQKA